MHLDARVFSSFKQFKLSLTIDVLAPFCTVNLNYRLDFYCVIIALDSYLYHVLFIAILVLIGFIDVQVAYVALCRFY